MLTELSVFLIETAGSLFTLALLLRFYLQWARVGYKNPVSQFVNALTNFIVLPARRVIPSAGGLDGATLILAWLVQFLELLLVLAVTRGLEGAGGGTIAMLLGVAALMILRLSIYILIVLVIAQAILSWVNPYSPIAPVLNALTAPFLRPFQRMIPPIGGVDLSPLFLIVVCQIVLMVLSRLV